MLKHKIILNNKKYIVRELTVGLFCLFLLDIEQFIEELFSEFNSDIPKFNEYQFEKFMEEYFEKKEKINTKTNLSTKQSLEVLKINIGKFMKHIGGSYQDILNMSLKDFIFMLENINTIAGEEKFIFSDEKNKEMKKSLKDLFNNQK